MSYNKGLVATLAELEEWYKGQNDGIGDIIELMNQTNDILSDIPWMESNMSDAHKTRVRTGLPEVQHKRMYKGLKPSKGEWQELKEACSMYATRCVLDLKEVELYGDRAKAFRLSEAKAHLEALRQKVAEALFYGNRSKNADEFVGLSYRLGSLGNPHVVNAGGTGSKLTSMYLISWGSDSVHGIYPKGSKAGVQQKDLGTFMAPDDNGDLFRAVGDDYEWDCGLALRDWRAVVRVANIDTTATELDIQALTIEAKNKLPESLRQKAIWYCNQEVMTLIEKQAINKNNVHLSYGEYFGSKGVPALHGRPIRQCDAILCTETAVK